jgi:hypothetical protein
MKALKLFCMAFIACYSLQTANAQSVIVDKKADEIKSIIDSRNYIFKANYVTPLRGGGKRLEDNYYDVTITKDKIEIYLPYYGRVYTAPLDTYNGGIKLTSTHFEYKSTPDKKGGWNIFIDPKEKDLRDLKDVTGVRLNVNSNGTAQLQVTSLNRDPISFSGTIEAPVDPKK